MSVDLFAPRKARYATYPSLADRIDASGDCWEWMGYRDTKGYGHVGGGTTGDQLIHRVVWVALVGPIIEGLTLDHLCRVRHCVNPDHLEPVTLEENIRRGYQIRGNTHPARQKTHCKQGHEFTSDNTYTDAKSGFRGCKMCRRNAARRHYAKQKAARA